MIAYVMLYTVAVGVPVLLAAIALAALLRRHGQPERGVWLVALALACVIPCATIVMRGQDGGSNAGPAAAAALGVPEVIALPAPAAAWDPGTVLLAAWVLASLVLALRWATAAYGLARAARSWRPARVDGVPVRLTENVGPAVAGTLRPRVIVPDWLLSVPQRERALILQHELEHIRARDPWLVALARAARVLAPWNPVVWVLAARLVRAVELDCDRRVLRRAPDVRTYGSTLLEVSARRPSRLVAVAAFAESEASLRSRILSMTTPSRAIPLLAILGAIVLGVVALVGALEIPVPTLRISVELGGGAAAEEAPAPVRVPAPADERPLAVLRRPSPSEAARQPAFTPYTVAPVLRNRQDVLRALTEAYPPLLRDAGIGGTVTVWFYIDETGTVRDVRVNESSGHGALDAAALAVAGVYRFSPAMNRDQPVAVWVSLPITFQIR